MTDKTTACPCGSGKALDDCCGPYVAGEKNAPTAEALMRSRYTAFALGNAKYLHDTLATAQQDGDEMSEDDLKAATWQKLTIRATEDGGENDDHGIVEFAAHYKAAGTQQVHHERASFIRENGRWVYETGIINPKSAPVTSQKVGRNDPCPCGSGKKYKKCCGANA